MEKLKFAYKLVILVLVCCTINAIFFNCINRSDVIYEQVYDDKNNIDIAFVGSSVVLNGCNPDVANQILEKNTCTAGTSGQIMQNSFYLVKEIIKENQVSTIFLEVGFVTQQVQTANRASTFLTNRGMKLNKNKIEFLWDAAGVDGLMNMCFPVLNCHINPIVAFKNRWFSNSANVDAGFYARTESVTEDTTFNAVTEINRNLLVSDLAKENLIKIIEYCKTNNIELILFCTPLPDATLINAKYYEEYNAYVQLLATEQNVKFWDFNLTKESILSMSCAEYADASHLNCNGAEKFTRVLCDTYIKMKSGELEEEDVFYGTYSDKIKYNMDDTYVE